MCVCVCVCVRERERERERGREREREREIKGGREGAAGAGVELTQTGSGLELTQELGRSPADDVCLPAPLSPFLVAMTYLLSLSDFASPQGHPG